MKRVTNSQLSFLFSLALTLSACGQNPGELDCGNGTIEDAEQCDDGNTVSGDGCSEVCELEDECGESCQDQIDAFIRGLDSLPAETEPNEPGVEQLPVTSGEYSCTKTTGVKQSLAVSDITALVTETLHFPGEILRGDSVYEGGFATVGLPRKPMTFSANIFNFSGAPVSGVMQDPTQSQFQDQLNALLAQAIGTSVVSANVSKDLIKVSSEQQLSIALGFDVSTLVGAGVLNLDGKFNFEDDTQRSRMVFKLVQEFYKAQVDAPGKPSDVFADEVTLEDIQNTFSDGNPPLYISSASYGRIVYFTFESEASETELEAALNVAFKGATDVNASTSLSAKEILESSTFNAIVVGGDPGDVTAALANVDTLIQFVNSVDSGKFDPVNNPPAVIAYHLSHLADNSDAAVAFSTGEFDELACERISQNIQVTLDSISLANGSDFGNNDLEIYGTISARSINEGILFDHADNNVVVIPNDATTPKLFGGAQFQKTIRINPSSPASNITLVADLFEDDGNSGDDDMPFTSVQINKDSTGVGADDLGFNGKYQMLISSAEGDLTITFDLTPVR